VERGPLAMAAPRSLLDWFSNTAAPPKEKSGPGLSDLCCSRKRVVIDVPDLPQCRLLMPTEGIYQIGAVCIDRNGMRPAPSSSEDERDRAATRHDSADAWWFSNLSAERRPLSDETPKKDSDHKEHKEAHPRRLSVEPPSHHAPVANTRQEMEERRAAAIDSKSGGWFGRSRSVEHKRQRVRIDDLVKIKGVSECLGKGVSGTVWKVVDKSVQEVLALKEMELDEDQGKCRMIVQEMQMMLHLEHANIVTCHGVFFDSKFQIVMEFMDAGSLLDLMTVANDHKIPIEYELRGISQQILKALVYLHTEKRVIHRDIKPGNILLNRLGLVKLADFGVASRPRNTRESTCASWVGTVTYMSPERITGEEYSFNADVWSLGIICVEAVLGRYPYLNLLEGERKFEFWDLLHTVTNTESAAKSLPQDTDVNFRSFAEFVLDKAQDTRPSSKQALAHPWIADAPADTMSKLSEWVRNGVHDRRTRDAEVISRGIRMMSTNSREASRETSPFRAVSPEGLHAMGSPSNRTFGRSPKRGDNKPPLLGMRERGNNKAQAKVSSQL